MINRQSSLGFAAMFATLALSACTQFSSEEQGDELGSTTQAIIGGKAATSSAYAAVGALVYYYPEIGVLDVFCSGTLVAPKAIVTARHCTPNIDLATQSGMIPAFAIGPDAFNPTAVIPITSYVNAPAAPGNEKGLLMDGGRDVAVAYLASAPVGVTPAKLGLFLDLMVGTSFDIAGYGVSTPDHFYGQKFVGKATARAIDGKWYPLLFNNKYESFRSWYYSDSPSAQRTEAEAKAWWKDYKLENKYELLAGGLKNEAVACNGDSGGPLLRGTTASTLTTYGVSFAVENTISSACGLGGGYLVFNAKMFEWVLRSTITIPTVPPVPPLPKPTAG
ncbi:MAG TPA: trypsin-like serine protease [Polyangiaceae bacterium]|nr:trypsin-like serine protease [Polyangiaceae bacterium]